MKCSSIMTTPPTRVYMDNTVREVAGVLLAGHMYNLPVVDRDDIFVGEISARAIVDLLLPASLTMESGLTNVGFMRESIQDLSDRFREAHEHAISRYMATDIDVVYPDSPLIDALQLLSKKYIRVAVVERDTRRLIGGISCTTILRAMEAFEARLDHH